MTSFSSRFRSLAGLVARAEPSHCDWPAAEQQAFHDGQTDYLRRRYFPSEYRDGAERLQYICGHSWERADYLDAMSAYVAEDQANARRSY